MLREMLYLLRQMARQMRESSMARQIRCPLVIRQIGSGKVLPVLSARTPALTKYIC